ncbi:MAG: hypothetical protein EB150_00965 [Nitrososphaeria archaeon]|nr:hypothetical protein [Nitrososphaeria archaeon]NDB50682.1 hypothetical protein [Nitrosopumilaceae archaeon]NDF26137.1 hypothetical protein [Nitrosopumilaceae archaeon]NDF28770.1 hypothetical protein [Nitrososphaeria archaeon]NDF35065.1 hypothetical protein [Nitrosopumilaceae archaeon]
MEEQLQIRRAFGILFVLVSVAVSVASALSLVVATNGYPMFWYAVIWLTSFGIPFGAYFKKSKAKLLMIRQRMKNSVHWPTQIKAINGLCWALPFALIGVFPSMIQYLILFGIGFGNLSTYIFMRKFSGLVNNEQLMVGVVSLAFVFVAVAIDQTLFVHNQPVAVFLSRILIAISYALGGIFALLAKK